MREKNIYIKRKKRKLPRQRTRKKSKKQKIILITIVILGMMCALNISLKSNEDGNSVEANLHKEVNDKNNLSNDLSNDLNDDKNYKVKNDPSVDDVADVAKYLNAQLRGEKVEDTDNKKVVYMTFDDGPSETVTPKILKTLNDENVKATFFVLGKSIEQSEKNRELLKQEVKEGHAIGNHTYSHDYENLYPGGSVSCDNFMAEIKKTNEVLKSVLGQDFYTRSIRFPGGHMSWKNSTEVDEVMAKNDYHYIDWNALSKDAEGPKKNAQQLLEEVKKTVGTQQKVVLLMHDTYGKEETAKALPSIIRFLKDNGYEFRTFK